MARNKDSGKKELMKGTMHYLWEEAKTMNRSKARAMKSMLKGYIKMKLEKKEPKKIQRNSISPLER